MAAYISDPQAFQKGFLGSLNLFEAVEGMQRKREQQEQQRATEAEQRALYAQAAADRQEELRRQGEAQEIESNARDLAAAYQRNISPVEESVQIPVEGKPGEFTTETRRRERTAEEIAAAEEQYSAGMRGVLPVGTFTSTVGGQSISMPGYSAWESARALAAQRQAKAESYRDFSTLEEVMAEVQRNPSAIGYTRTIDNAGKEVLRVTYSAPEGQRRQAGVESTRQARLTLAQQSARLTSDRFAFQRNVDASRALARFIDKHIPLPQYVEAQLIQDNPEWVTNGRIDYAKVAAEGNLATGQYVSPNRETRREIADYLESRYLDAQGKPILGSDGRPLVDPSDITKLDDMSQEVPDEMMAKIGQWYRESLTYNEDLKRQQRTIPVLFNAVKPFQQRMTQAEVLRIAGLTGTSVEEVRALNNMFLRSATEKDNVALWNRERVEILKAAHQSATRTTRTGAGGVAETDYNAAAELALDIVDLYNNTADMPAAQGAWDQALLKKIEDIVSKPEDYTPDQLQTTAGRNRVAALNYIVGRFNEQEFLNAGLQPVPVAATGRPAGTTARVTTPGSTAQTVPTPASRQPAPIYDGGEAAPAAAPTAPQYPAGAVISDLLQTTNGDTFRTSTVFIPGGDLIQQKPVVDGGPSVYWYRTDPQTGNIRIAQPAAEPAPAAGEGAAPAPSGALAPAAESTYTIRAGDSLSRIAQRQLGSAGRWRELAQLNGIAAPYTIYPGRTLRLPGGATPGGAPAPQPAPGPSGRRRPSELELQRFAEALAIIGRANPNASGEEYRKELNGYAEIDNLELTDDDWKNIQLRTASMPRTAPQGAR